MNYFLSMMGINNDKVCYGSDNMLSVVPDEIFVHEIFPFLTIFDLSRIERTSKRFQKYILSMRIPLIGTEQFVPKLYYKTFRMNDAKRKKIPRPNEQWFRKFKNIISLKIQPESRRTVELVHFKDIVRYTIFHSLELRRIDIRECPFDDPNTLIEIGKRFGNTLLSINLQGHDEIKDRKIYKEFFGYCKRLEELYLGSRFARRAGVYACFCPTFSIATFSPLIENKLKFKKIVLFGLRFVHDQIEKEESLKQIIKGINEQSTVAERLLKYSNETIEKLNICGIQHPQDITFGFSVNTLKLYPQLKRVRFSHSNINIFFQHHCHLEMYEGILYDDQLIQLIRTNGKTIRKLIIYDKSPKPLGSDSSNTSSSNTNKKRLTDKSIKELCHFERLVDFRIIFPFYVGSYESWISSKDIFLKAFRKIEERSSKINVIDGRKDNVEIMFYDQKEELLAKIFWDRWMDYDWGDM